MQLQASTEKWAAFGEASLNQPMTLKLIDPRLSEVKDDQSRFAAWQDLTSSLFVSKKREPASTNCEPSFRCFNLDRLLFLDHSIGAHDAERTPAQIVSQGVDHILLGLHTFGVTCLMRSDGDAVATAGDFVVLDLAQTFRSVTDGSSAIHICIPRRHFDSRGRKIGAWHMEVLPSRTQPLLKLLSDHLFSMRACLDHVEHEQRHLLTSAALSVCNAAFTPSKDSAYNQPAIAAIEIRQFIEDNIEQLDLGVDLLCTQFGLSRTPLYKMFEVDGGIATYIRNRRLARAMRILAGVEGRSRQRVSSVAYACGYESAKMFSRAFHRRYGINPREVNTAFQAVAIRERGALLASWIQNL
ncbi:helix-turn-helix transcriptional regulator [Bradyrhizobium paxllaeri]|uniref:helix-turn-helix transcriptional regulator n=1 Tax=Bradyrhizobium paxllaeri TaxID=190148 RepID=UPI000A077F1D|nr:AraC family transcriptional regulator [Bradyrhizobium paxllaeri]